ncbi:MAG TPA: hypothetical protein VF407_05015 [Polyangiaceae bacterium]
MGAYAHSRSRSSSSTRAEPVLPRVLRSVEVGSWLLAIIGAMIAGYTLYARMGAQGENELVVLVHALGMCVAPYVLARSVAALRHSIR